MKNFKKILGAVFVVALMLGITSCGNDDSMKLKIDNKSSVEIEEVILAKKGEKGVKPFKDSDIDENESFKVNLDKSFEKDSEYILTIVLEDGENYQVPIKLEKENKVKIEGNKVEFMIKANGGKAYTFTKKVNEAKDSNGASQETTNAQQQVQTSNTVTQNTANQTTTKTVATPAQSSAPQQDKNQETCVTDALLND